MKMVIINTVILTIFAVISLSLNMNTYMTFVAFISDAYIGYISYIFYKMVTNENYTKNIIHIEFERNKKIDLTKYFARWVDEYKEAIINDNKSSIEAYSEILSLCLKQEKGQGNQGMKAIIQTRIQNMFDDARKYNSFVDAFNLVFCINGKYDYREFDYNMICHNCINRIKFYPAEDLLALNFSGTISNILESNFPNDLKVSFIFYYFDAVIYSHESEEIRMKIFENGLREISSIHNSKYDLVKSKILLKIFVNLIIANGNFNFSKRIFELFIKSLYLNNLLNSDVLFVTVIANIFRCVYFYGFINFSLFNDTQRENIKSLASHVLQIDWLTPLSIDKLCLPYDEKILDYYIREFFYSDSGLCNDDFFYATQDKFELGHLYMLWGENNKVKFIFWFFLSRSTKKELPLIDCFIQKYPKQRKKAYYLYSEILNLYDHDSLTDYSIERVKNFYIFKGNDGLNYSPIITDYKAKKAFNDIHSKVESLDTDVDNIDVDCKEIFEKINKTNLFEKICDVDTNICIDNVVPCEIICPIDWDTFEEIDIPQIKPLVIQKFWDTLKRSILVFGEIQHDYSWLKENNVKVNYRIIGIKKKKPTKIQIESYINTKRVSNNEIVIDNNAFTYEEAKHYIEENKSLLVITAKIAIKNY